MFISWALVASITLLTSILVVGILSASADAVEISPSILISKAFAIILGVYLRWFMKILTDFLDKRERIAS